MIIRYSQINLLVLILITNICYPFINEKSNYNNFQHIDESKVLSRDVDFFESQFNLYNKNSLLTKKNKKRSVNYNNNENYRKKRMISSDPKAKWNLPIPYFVDFRVSHLLVDSALRMITKETCIKFKKYKVLKPGIAGIYYYYGENCSSPVGQQGKRIWQLISIGPHCDNIGRVQHETLHALGFFHEHSRYDRDEYVIFQYENINKNHLTNFRKVSKKDSNTFDVPFDFGSVMMYGPRMLSMNGKNTMISYDHLYQNTYGVVDQISFGDIKMLNFYYCFKQCPIKITCMNGGYQDPNNCRKCKCVKGFIGPYCNALSLPTKECGQSQLHATDEIKEFGALGKKDCIYHILCEKKKRIAIKILASFFYPNKERTCHRINSLEVKYWGNKISTGARFCLYKSNIMIYSYNSHVIIYFRSRYKLNHFHILYKAIPRKIRFTRVNREFSNYEILTNKKFVKN